MTVRKVWEFERGEGFSCKLVHSEGDMLIIYDTKIPEGTDEEVIRAFLDEAETAGYKQIEKYWTSEEVWGYGYTGD